MARALASLAQALLRRALPEERLLFACLHQSFDDPARARVAACATQVQAWDAVLRIAVRHQVAPLVLHALGAADVLERVADAVRASLHHEMLRNVAAKAVMRSKLIAVLNEFAAEGLDVMAVKGTSLDLRLRDPALTVSGDIDLLVRQDWAQTSAAMHARVAALNAGTPVVDIDCARHPDLVMNGVLPVDFAGIWAQATRAPIGDAPLFRMRVEHDLLCACINSARKRFFRLKSLFELAELLRTHPDLDWNLVVRDAHAWRCSAIAFVALTATAATTGAPIPVDLAKRFVLSRVRVRALESLIARMSFSRLATLHTGVRLRGKSVGRALMLVYASLGRGAARAAWCSLRRTP